jgi:hypothetical protein
MGRLLCIMALLMLWMHRHSLIFVDTTHHYSSSTTLYSHDIFFILIVSGQEQEIDKEQKGLPQKGG